ncbi:hypothetical protein EVAR_78278_1 [Eumeta japonica]|uniref:Uncharacterized protein n=1 Tax=Eumeta variegata TaxID=151549 RepID=A0A4C1T624_EUMVA|nr:hypothetical protein EVAR_78278_1 [Eumeta japonica]
MYNGRHGECLSRAEAAARVGDRPLSWRATTSPRPRSTPKDTPAGDPPDAPRTYIRDNNIIIPNFHLLNLYIRIEVAIAVHPLCGGRFECRAFGVKSVFHLLVCACGGRTRRRGPDAVLSQLPGGR